MLPGHPQMPGRSWRAGKARGDGKPVGPDRPLGKGVRGIETSGSGYLRPQIRGGRKGRAERQGLGQQHNPAKKSARSATRASSDAGPELAGRESHHGDGKPAGPDRPLGKGAGGIKTNARSVRVWGSAPIQKKESPQTNV